MDIELNSLLVFKHVAEKGSFTETAKHWKISQPTVSTLIARLESSVGLILFERSSAGTHLTPAGIDFLKWASEVCDAYLAFIVGIRTLGRRMDREVLVGVDKSWHGQLVRAQMESNASLVDFPVRICDVDDSWWDGLESSKYDVVVATRFLQAGLTAGIQEGVIHKERGMTVAWNPDFYPFNPEQFNFPEALRTTVLIPDASVVSGFAPFLLLWCDCAYGFRPPNMVTFPSEREAASAAAAGLGIFIGPGDAIPRLEENGRGLSSVRTFEFLLPLAFTFGVYCRGGEDSKEVMSVAASISRMGSAMLRRGL